VRAPAAFMADAQPLPTSPYPAMKATLPASMTSAEAGRGAGTGAAAELVLGGEVRGAMAHRAEVGSTASHYLDTTQSNTEARHWHPYTHTQNRCSTNAAQCCTTGNRCAGANEFCHHHSNDTPSSLTGGAHQSVGE
jgi:hypothetical protein